MVWKDVQNIFWCSDEDIRIRHTKLDPDGSQHWIIIIIIIIIFLRAGIYHTEIGISCSRYAGTRGPAPQEHACTSICNVNSKDTQGRHQGVNSLQLWGGGYMRNSGTAMGGCGGMQFNKCGTEDLFNNVWLWVEKNLLCTFVSYVLVLL